MHVNGIELFCEVVGAGEPILMLHGNGLDHTLLRPWHDGLASDARLIYYDQRWNGRSERAGGTDHATAHADAAALLDQLDAPRVTLLGHSYGSWLALGFARKYPERVRALILCGTSPVFDHATQAIATAQARNPEAAHALVEGFTHGVTSDEQFADLWRTILPLYFHGPTRAEVLERTRFSAPGFTHAMAALVGFSMIDSLPSMTTPILAIVGRDDYITPPEQARRLAALAPNATVVELARSGHFPFVEETDEYLAAIRAWWPTTAP